MAKASGSVSEVDELTAKLERCRHTLDKWLKEFGAIAAEIETIDRRISEILNAAPRKSPRPKKAKAKGKQNKLVVFSDSVQAQLQKGAASARAVASAWQRAEYERHAKVLRALANLTRTNNERVKALIRGTIPGIRATLFRAVPARGSTQAAAAPAAKQEA